MDEEKAELNNALRYPDPNWAYFQCMSARLRGVMDILLVKVNHPIAYEAGTNEQRFKTLHKQGYQFG